MTRRRLDWSREGRDWPLREHSRFVETSDMRWHCQRLGAGEPVLLVHGTGASAHSWHALAERLAPDFELIVPDLPGHGFSSAPPTDGFSLPGMARRLAELVRALAVEPRFVVGHSAGSAVACRMALDGSIRPGRIVSLNGALLPFRPSVRGSYGFGARALASSGWVARLVAWQARDPDTVDRLIRGSGSTLERREVDWYARLAGSPEHVRSALRMMAGWDLVELETELPRLDVPVTLVHAEGDRFVAPDQAMRVGRRLPKSESIELPSLGHLAHEERPDRIEALLRDLFAVPAGAAAAP